MRQTGRYLRVVIPRMLLELTAAQDILWGVYLCSVHLNFCKRVTPVTSNRVIVLKYFTDSGYPIHSVLSRSVSAAGEMVWLQNILSQLRCSLRKIRWFPAEYLSTQTWLHQDEETKPHLHFVLRLQSVWVSTKIAFISLSEKYISAPIFLTQITDFPWLPPR